MSDQAWYATCLAVIGAVVLFAVSEWLFHRGKKP
jgi:hypothetical protein